MAGWISRKVLVEAQGVDLWVRWVVTIAVERIWKKKNLTLMLKQHLVKRHPHPSHHHHHHYLSHQLAYRATRKLLHPCLSLASLGMVPQMWFMFFISASTVLHRVLFGRPRFHFPSEVHWIATLVMELASLHSTCPIQHHHFQSMMVFTSSCWHHAKRSR